MMPFVFCLILAIVLIVLAFVIAHATVLLCLCAAFLLVTCVLPSFPWLAMAGATWLLLQFIAGLKSVVSAAKAANPPK